VNSVTLYLELKAEVLSVKWTENSFSSKSQAPGLDVGAEMPTEWDYQPANVLARSQLQEEESFVDDNYEFSRVLDSLYDGQVFDMT
jgi:hypothetical protein